MKNVIQGKTSWKNLCELSRGLCNPIDKPCPFKEELVYIWMTPAGVRQESPRWVRGIESQLIVHDVIMNEMQEGDGSAYQGFPEREILEVKFESASSGAQLIAERKEGGWFLTFVGVDTDERPERTWESAYYADFKKAVGERGIIVMEKGPLSLD